MALPEISIEDFYPVIHQAVLDTMKVESLLFHYPYEGIEQIDMGLRKLIWSDYSTNNQAIFDLSRKQPTYQILVAQSQLGFYNIIVGYKKEEYPDIITFLPFRTRPISIPEFNRIMQGLKAGKHNMGMLYRIYSAMPVVDLDELLTTIRHMMSAFVPGFEKCEINYLNYNDDEMRESDTDEERLEKFSSETIVASIGRWRECVTAIRSGEHLKAAESMKILMDSTGSLLRMPTGTLSEMKQTMTGLNMVLASLMFETPVHPYYTYMQMESFMVKIEQMSSYVKLQHLPIEMTRKYSMLARNYTYDSYSYLIRNVVNYVDQNLSSDLSLSVLADIFHKNASYLSACFTKEVGMPLTNYIAKQRMQAALQYFNLSNMSVAEVAQAVGISDFGYFSKLFKRYVGVSPREYRSMLDK